MHFITILIFFTFLSGCDVDDDSTNNSPPCNPMRGESCPCDQSVYEEGSECCVPPKYGSLTTFYKCNSIWTGVDYEVTSPPCPSKDHPIVCPFSQ
jgi:hypothetical protein